jgi:hypothetical protein
LGVSLVIFLLRLGLQKKEGWQAVLRDARRRAVASRKGIIISFLLALTAWSFAFFFNFLRLMNDMGAYVRLLPILLYGFLIGLESLLFIALEWLGGRKKTAPRRFKELFRMPFWIALIVMAALYLLVEMTGIGKNPQFVSIISLGVPLLEGQIEYACGLNVLVLCLAGAWGRLPLEERRNRKLNIDLLVCVALWLLAAGLWLSLPLPKHNYFAPEQLPPNYSIYPFSDAEQYDMNSLWVWKGSIKDTVISKPLYIVFLSILHALVGYDYGKVILLQTLVLAILPAVIYLVGKEMHSRMGA